MPSSYTPMPISCDFCEATFRAVVGTVWRLGELGRHAAMTDNITVIVALPDVWYADQAVGSILSSGTFFANRLAYQVSTDLAEGEWFVKVGPYSYGSIGA